jgi:hypothetical protein
LLSVRGDTFGTPASEQRVGTTLQFSRQIRRD